MSESKVPTNGARRVAQHWVGCSYTIDRKSPNFLRWTNSILKTDEKDGSVIVSPQGGATATTDITYSESAKKTATNLAGSLGLGGSYKAFSAEVQASFEQSSEISGKFLRVQRDILVQKKTETLASIPYQDRTHTTLRGLLDSKIKEDSKWEKYVHTLEEAGYGDIDILIEAFKDLSGSLQEEPHSMPKGAVLQLKKILETQKSSSVKVSRDVLTFARNNSAKDFVKTYGEFYATRAVLGGVFRVIHITETSEEHSAQSLKASFEAGFNALIFSVKTTGSLERGTSSANSSLQATTRSIAQGGDTEVWLQLNEGNLEDIQKEWAKTLTDDSLYPVEMTVRPIWELLKEDEDVQSKVKNHLTEQWDNDHKQLEGLDLAIGGRKRTSQMPEEGRRVKIVARKDKRMVVHTQTAAKRGDGVINVHEDVSLNPILKWDPEYLLLNQTWIYDNKNRLRPIRYPNKAVQPVDDQYTMRTELRIWDLNPDNVDDDMHSWEFKDGLISAPGGKGHWHVMGGFTNFTKIALSTDKEYFTEFDVVDVY